jgi:hypothetical protein
LQAADRGLSLGRLLKMRLTVEVGGRFEPNHPLSLAIHRHPLSQDLRAQSGAGLLRVRLVMVC